MNKKEKTIKETLIELFNLTKKEAFLDVTTQDGSTLRTTDDTLKVGSKVTLIGTDGSESPVTDGDYTLSDGSCATVKSGVVESITPAPAVDPSTDANTADATTAPSGTAMADGQVDAPVAGTIAPQADAATPSAPAADGDDMNKLLEIIKNITDRLSALEEKIGETKMAVQKMASAPAASQFNKQSPATPSDYFAAYKAKVREKESLESKIKKHIANVASEIPKEKPQEFHKIAPNAPTPAPQKFSTNKKNIDLGMPMGGFSVSN